MLQLGIEGFNRGGAHLLNHSIGAVNQLAMVGADRLMGAPMNVQRSVEEIGFDQAAAAMGTEAADLAMGHLAGREAGHHPIGKAQGGIDPQQAAGRGAAGTELLLQVGHFGQDAAGVAQHGFTFHCQAHAPRGAVEQGHTQAGFHLRQAFAGSGRGHHLSGERTKINAWQPLLIAAQGTPLFARSEMDQTWQKAMYFVNRPLNFYWGALTGLQNGQSIWDVSAAAMEACKENDLYNNLDDISYSKEQGAITLSGEVFYFLS